MQLIRPRADAGGAGGGRSGRGSVVEGLRFIRRSAAMPAILLAVVLSNGAVEALRTLAPTLADGLDRPEAAGVLIMGYSVGAMLGLVSYGLIERVLPRRWMLVTAFALQAVGVACVALAPNLPLTVLAAAPIGIGFSLSTPLLSASLQTLSPDDFRSRVMSAFSIAHLGLRPLFALVAGALATVLSTEWALGAFAGVAVLAAAFAWRRRVAQS
jgi:predicted MFS family arabinose efflux permease